MFCTIKEQETCREEKMGCEGCFYYYDINKRKSKKDMKRFFEFVDRIKELAIESSDKIYCKMPERSTKNSAGYDFYNPETIEIPPYKIGDDPVMVATGIKAYMPNDEFLMLVNRSSNPKKKKLVIPSSMGIIDADYYDNSNNEGEMFFAFYNLSKEPIIIKKGERLGQGIFMKYNITDDDNAQGERSGGFGSTGC